MSRSLRWRFSIRAISMASIFSTGIMRILGPRDLAEIRSTKCPSCFIPTVSGRPDLLVFCTMHYLLGDILILLRPDGIGRIGKYRFFVGRAFLELDALRNVGLEELGTEDFSDP